jgi:TetR/AcrR family transcriptional regulator, regulator of autoinduction and epiphytic fitness
MAKPSEEKIVAAARQVFMRYGYRRVTMSDLAEAAQMSRPGLYLVFSSKAEVLTAVVTRVFAEMLDEIRSGVERLATPREKLIFAMEVWCVRGYETVQASPDAKDLLESSYEFAAEVTTKTTSDFVVLVAGILKPLVKNQSRVSASSAKIARMLVGAALGFKSVAKTTKQLREMLSDQITIILASLQQNESA